MIRRILRGGARRARSVVTRLSDALFAARRSRAMVQAELAAVREAVRQLRAEMTSQLSVTSHDLHESLKSEIQAELAAVREAVRQLSVTSHDLHEDLKSEIQSVEAGLTARLAGLEASVASTLDSVGATSLQRDAELIQVFHDADARLQRLENASFEAKNAIAHIDTSVHSRLNDILNVRFPGLLEQIHTVASFQMEQRTAPECGAPSAARPQPTAIEPFEVILTRAEADIPSVFGLWRERLDAVASAFAQTKHGNAAHAGDVYSRLFRTFVERHVRGQVLDVGCGPFGRPYYLTGYPAERISGIEPLPFPENSDIQILRGISEYLPFADGSFDTVISGTSLDHCLSLDKSLDEMARVLRPDGVVLLWLGSNPGAPRYDPLAPDFAPADEYHLFHFDHAWLEPMLEQRFDLVDRITLERAGWSHVFYALSHRTGVAGD